MVRSWFSDQATCGSSGTGSRLSSLIRKTIMQASHRHAGPVYIHMHAWTPILYAGVFFLYQEDDPGVWILWLRDRGGVWTVPHASLIPFFWFVCCGTSRVVSSWRAGDRLTIRIQTG